uniref:zinc finger protein CONSTANS-LIKE 9-like n=1 Tax=Erigeron canadensis TaxID=72917 RepID=UPI001CB9609A|nr:zinc finger protein CONSTANS-LIKE 9-like [Erigeron canadensis]XP_043621449.1 zinc finger protein CONSTANS-LIKE 9-like [Erigeron canadensis]
MGYQCDHCGEARSMVYCRSDAAYLCLSCDRVVHSANALSKRHSRTLICDKCNSQPALVRCIEEKVSLCQNCDWVGHNDSTNGSSTHSRQTLNCYSGCPSAVELSSIWSFMSESHFVNDSACEQEMGSMSIADNSQGPSRSNNSNQDILVTGEENRLQSGKNTHAFTGSSSVHADNSPQNVAQEVGPVNSSTSKISHSGTKELEPFVDNDGFYVDFNMDEVDLSIENYEELFGVGHNDPEHLFAKDGIDSLFGGAESSYAAKESSTGQANPAQPTCSNASADSLVSCKTEPTRYGRQHSNISFSSLTGESSAGEYQDCGASSMLLMGEPPWCTPGVAPSNTPSGSRSDAVLRYKEKKKMRKFDKRVRYATRKARADVRKRVKGRFVKAGDAYDYDPMSQTRSF